MSNLGYYLKTKQNKKIFRLDKDIFPSMFMAGKYLIMGRKLVEVTLVRKDGLIYDIKSKINGGGGFICDFS